MTIGSAIREYREASGQPQAELADAMREAGFKWSQATVWSLEKDERTLTYSEAVALTSFWGVPLNALNDESVVVPPRIGLAYAINLLQEAERRGKY